MWPRGPKQTCGSNARALTAPHWRLKTPLPRLTAMKTSTSPQLWVWLSWKLAESATFRGSKTLKRGTSGKSTSLDWPGKATHGRQHLGAAGGSLPLF
ncbi:hypothetical protein MC885_002163 [Smutsia gigantea]|nr:hypothetical protein MC885_002163 [Smutsia gigantea]